MEFVKELTHKHMLAYTKAMREFGGETLQGYEYMDAQIQAAQKAEILTDIENIDDMKPSEILEIAKKIKELYYEAITPDTKN